MDSLRSSGQAKRSQPQLLSPKFFEQRPKLLPPSTFRHPVGQGQVDHEACAAQAGEAVSSAGANKETKPSKKQKESLVKAKELVDHSATKKIKLTRSPDKANSLEGAEDQDEATFDAKYDNQLLLNILYTQAVKQRWKDSEGLVAEKVTSGKDVNKFLEYTNPRPVPKRRVDILGNSSTAKGQDTPTASWNEIESRAPSSLKANKDRVEASPNIIDAKREVRPLIKPPVSQTECNELSPATARSVSCSSSHDTPLKDHLSSQRARHFVANSPSVSSVALCTDIPRRNNLDEVKEFANKPQTTDNLKLKQDNTSLALTTEETTCSQRVGTKSASRDHSRLSSLPRGKSKASPALVCVKSHCSSTTATPAAKTMAVAMDTQNDLALADVLQSEEYSCESTTRPSANLQVRKKEEQTKQKRLDIDCSSDFEIARRLQQDIDAEIAYSMQSQDQHHHQDRGHRLGGDEVQTRDVSEEVEGHYDNNNQYKYRIREHHSGYQGASVGSGARGTSSFSRRQVPHQRYNSGARGPVTAIPMAEVDMSYETLVELEDVSRGLDKATISRLSNTYRYHCSSDSTVKSCSVCLNEFEDGQVLRSLPCIHVFHKNCIDKWLTNNKHCPVCMKDIDTM